MCTVSFVAANNQCIFTFSRDEQPERQTPYYINHKKLGFKEIYFVKDSKAGGTWFAADSTGNIALLFNGGFSRYKKLPLYKRSRGVLLLELISSNKLKDYFYKEDLNNTAPFSIILFEDKMLFRLTWDGNKKHQTVLVKDSAHIFSSATLYNKNIRQLRKEWLKGYLEPRDFINSDTVFDFHNNYKKEDKENGLLIERKGSCSTLSISQAIWQNDNMQLKHLDIKTGKIYQQQILLN